MIEKRVLRTGDGSHEYSQIYSMGQALKNADIVRDVEHFWGWNDELLTSEDKADVTIINKTDD